MSFQVTVPSFLFLNSQTLKKCVHRLFLSLVVGIIFSCRIHFPQEIGARSGVLDAQNYPFSYEILELGGDWEFFPYEFLDPQGIEDKSQRVKLFVRAGEPWQNAHFPDGRNFPGFGYGTYRLKLKLPQLENDTKQYALFVPAIHSAYRLFVNGKEYHRNGAVSNSIEKHSPSLQIAIVPLGSKNYDLDILLHVSNFSLKNGGMRSFIKVGELEKIYSWWNAVQIGSWFLVIFLFILSLYHFLLYQLRKTERTALRIAGLYFGIFILCFTNLETRILFNLLPNDLCLTIIRLIKLGFALALYSGGYILFRMPGLPIFFRFLSILKVYTAVYVVCIFLLPVYYLGKVGYYFEITSSVFVILGIVSVSISLVYQKKDSKVFFYSLILGLVGGVVDILHLFNILTAFKPIGLYSLHFFIIPQTIGATYSLFTIYKRTEILSKDLFKRKEILEKKVKARTTELEKANRWKANFVSLISHDLRSPLNSVQQLLDLILFNFKTTTETEKIQFLEMSKQGVTQSLKMMEQLLDVSRFDAIGTKLIQTKFSLNDLLNEVIVSVEPLALLKEILIKKESTLSENTQIIADRTLIGEVFKNILGNAIKFSFPKTTITIVVSVKGKWISIEFRDRGLGMSDEQIQQLTGDELVKSIPGTNGERGTGLGLKLCYSIMEAHFGKLRIKSVMGVGSSFEVSLTKSNKSILLIDDSENYRSDLAEVLRRNQWIVIEASQGEEALLQLGRLTPSVIVVDKNMPVMNGVSFLHEWEGRRYERKIPIILLSSDAPISGNDGFLEEEGLEGVVNLYLSKMYRVEDVVQFIESTVP